MTPSKNRSFLVSTWFWISETKNQGLKVPRWDQDQDFVSQDQDREQDIKTESRDVSRPRFESQELHHWYFQQHFPNSATGGPKSSYLKIFTP